MKFYTAFPRLIGQTREDLVDNIKDFMAYVKKWNGRKNLFTSVYSFDEYSWTSKYGKKDWPVPVYSSAIIDRIYWDIDPEDNHPMTIDERVIYLSLALTKDEIMHFILFSGSGYAVYAITDDYPVAPDKKKSTVRCIQEHYDRKAGELFGLNKEEHGVVGIEADPTSYGDIARISRIPGSLNLKYRGFTEPRYCIFIGLNDIRQGRSVNMSKKGQHGKGFINNIKKINLAYWEEEAESYIDTSGEDLYRDGIEQTAEFKTEWYCVKEAFNDCRNGIYKQNGLNRERYIVLSFFVNAGYSSRQARRITKNDFHPRIYQDMVSESQLKHVYTQGVLFPSRSVMKKEGRCNECGLCPE